jgi:hypothetical protein
MKVLQPMAVVVIAVLCALLIACHSAVAMAVAVDGGVHSLVDCSDRSGCDVCVFTLPTLSSLSLLSLMRWLLGGVCW